MLSEEQIHRYSRQILLGRVGGVGQQRLLELGAQAVGQGPALPMAIAYLGAGGTSVRAQKGLVAPGEQGFLFVPGDVGHRRNVRLDRALREMNPDATGAGSPGCLLHFPGEFSGPGPWVGMGRKSGRPGLVYRSERGCLACFAALSEHFGAGEASPISNLVGCMAALVFQRLCLGLSADLGGLWVDSAGRVTPMDIRSCPSCKS